MAVSAESLEVFLADCSLCSKPIEDPRIIDCHHSFCCSCLIKHCPVTVDDQGRQISNCPNCSLSFEVPLGGLKNLRKFCSCYVAAMLCEVCSRDLVEYRCEECKEYFCIKCSNYHAMFKATRGHTHSRIKERTKTNEYKICKVHNKNVDIFCQQCSTFGCISCHAEQHNGHAFMLLPQKFNDVKRHLSNALLAKSNVHKLILDRMIATESLREDSKRTADSIKKQISSEGDKLKAIVDGHVKQLHVELDGKLQMYKDKVGTEIQNMEKLKGDIQKEIWDLEESLRSLDFVTVIDHVVPAVAEPNLAFPSFVEAFAPAYQPGSSELLTRDAVGGFSDGSANESEEPSENSASMDPQVST